MGLLMDAFWQLVRSGLAIVQLAVFAFLSWIYVLALVVVGVVNLVLVLAGRGTLDPDPLFEPPKWALHQLMVLFGFSTDFRPAPYVGSVVLVAGVGAGLTAVAVIEPATLVGSPGGVVPAAMLAGAIGRQRAEYLWRATIGAVWFIVATVLIWVIWFPIALVVKFLDGLIWQLLLNREGPVPDATLQAPFGYWVDNVEWVLFGQDSFNPLPYV